MTTLIILLLAALAVLLVGTWAKGFCQPRSYALENVAEGEALEGIKTFYADANHPARFMFVKKGTDASHVALAATADDAIGVCLDTPAAGDACAVALFGAARGTKRVTANGVINFGELITADTGGNSGYAIKLSASAGTYRVLGRAVNPAASAAGDIIEFVPFAYTFVTVS